MGFSSLDSLTAAMSGGQKERVWFQKTSANAAAGVGGRWYDLFQGGGFPSAGTYPGTAGVATAMNRSTLGALPLGPNVSPDTRHLIKLAAGTSTGTVVPGTLLLCDFLLYYPALVVTGAPTTLDNTVTLPRYTDGAGVMAMVAVQSAHGAAVPSLTFTYTDQAGNSSVAPAHAAPGSSAPVSTAYGALGVPFMPLAAGDTGVRKLDSYTLASGTTGSVAAVLVKPLAEIPLIATWTMSMANLVHELPSLERVHDDACLGFMVGPGGAMAANAVIFGSVEWAWD